MKNVYTIVALLILVSVNYSTAFGRERLNDFERFQTKSTYKPEIVKWTGIIHSVLRDDVELQFVRSSDKEKFDIVDSTALEQFDWKNHKSRLVKIAAERTPKFLFWGGNLIVKNFKIIKETGRYAMPTQLATHEPREFLERESR